MLKPEKEPIQVVVDVDLQELVPGFLSLRRQDIQNIRTSLADEDFSKIRRIGHNLKGSGGGYGFDHISDIGFRIQQAAEAGAITDIEACASELADYLERVEISYS